MLSNDHRWSLPHGNTLVPSRWQATLATARQLLWSDQPSDGFTTLWSHHRLDLTIEAHLLKPDYRSLFTEADRQQARRRLELHGWHEKLSEAT